MVDQFGIDGDQAMSLIAAGAQNGLDTSGNLMDNITQYAEEFAQAGYSADDMFKIMQAGTERFGDEWTDMGPDVVAQLADIQDGAYDTADAMGTIKDIKYDDLGSMLEELKRSIDLLLLPLGEALMPAAGNLNGSAQAVGGNHRGFFNTYL